MSLVETTYMGEIRDWGKTKGSLRTIPLSRDLAKELCTWELECPDTSPDAFIFPNAKGGFIDTGNYRKRVLHNIAPTTDVYMQEIPEGVQATIDSIHRELRKSSKPDNTRSGKKTASQGTISKKTGSGTGRAGVSEGRKLQERRSASDFKTHSQKGFENLLPNATKVLRTGVTPTTASA